MAISDQTTNLSNLSVEGRVSGNTGAFTTTVTAASFTASGAGTSSLGTIVGSFVSTTALTTSSFVSLGASRLSVGGGAALTFVSAYTFSVQTLTLAATQSTSTDATVNAIASGDALWVAPPASGLSNGISVNAWASGNSTVRLQFSNASTAAATASGPVTYTVFVVRR